MSGRQKLLKRGRKEFTMDKNNSGVLKVFGIVMILFGAIYAIVGTMALVGELGGILPGHEAQETIIVVLAYVVALLAIICGIACMKGASICRPLGLLFGVIGLVSLLYLQFTQGSFNIFDCIAMVFGIAIFVVAGKKN